MAAGAATEIVPTLNHVILILTERRRTSYFLKIVSHAIFLVFRFFFSLSLHTVSRLRKHSSNTQSYSHLLHTQAYLCPPHHDAFRPALTSSHVEYRAAQYTPQVFSCETALSFFASFPPSSHTIATTYIFRSDSWVVNDLLPNQIRTTTIPTSLRKRIS